MDILIREDGEIRGLEATLSGKFNVVILMVKDRVLEECIDAPQKGWGFAPTIPQLPKILEHFLVVVCVTCLVLCVGFSLIHGIRNVLRVSIKKCSGG